MVAKMYVIDHASPVCRIRKLMVLVTTQIIVQQFFINAKEMNEENDSFIPLPSPQLSQKVMQWCQKASLIQIMLEMEK